VLVRADESDRCQPSVLARSGGNDVRSNVG
jgi:hypothetical protein